MIGGGVGSVCEREREGFGLELGMVGWFGWFVGSRKNVCVCVFLKRGRKCSMRMFVVG